MAHSAQISFGWCTSVLDLSKHTCTTRLSLRRGEKVVVILAWSLNLLGFEPPSQTIWSPFWLIAVVTSSARACAFTRMYLIGFAYVWVRVRRGRAGIGAARGGVCYLPCLPSAVAVWCDVRSRAVLTPRIILKTHTSSPPDNLHSHAHSRAGTKPCQRSNHQFINAVAVKEPYPLHKCFFMLCFFLLWQGGAYVLQV